MKTIKSTWTVSLSRMNEISTNHINRCEDPPLLPKQKAGISLGTASIDFVSRESFIEYDFFQPNGKLIRTPMKMVWCPNPLATAIIIFYSWNNPIHWAKPSRGEEIIKGHWRIVRSVQHGQAVQAVVKTTRTHSRALMLPHMSIIFRLQIRYLCFCAFNIWLQCMCVIGVNTQLDEIGETDVRAMVKGTATNRWCIDNFISALHSRLSWKNETLKADYTRISSFHFSLFFYRLTRRADVHVRIFYEFFQRIVNIVEYIHSADIEQRASVSGCEMSVCVQ